MTYSTFLANHGWQEINLFDNTVDLDRYLLWGHLTEPHARHTKGVCQYLYQNPDIDYLNPAIAKMLVSAVFDEHTYSLNMMLGKLFDMIYWIPLDATITKWNQYPILPDKLGGDDLTNYFFKENNIDLIITPDCRINVAKERDLQFRKIISDYKNLYYNNYQKLVKNFIEPDLIKYQTVLKFFEAKYL
jgi:hypothetical protein